MNRILTTHLLALISVISVGLFFLAHVLFGSEPVRQVANALLIGIDVTIVVSWRSAAFFAWRSGARSGAEKIVLTIWMSWMILLLQRLYTGVFWALGRPEWLLDLPVGGLVLVGLVVVGMYAVLAPLYAEKTDEDLSVASDVLGAGIVGGLAAIVVLVSYFVFGGSY